MKHLLSPIGKEGRFESSIATHSQTTLHQNELGLASCTKSHHRHLGGA